MVLLKKQLRGAKKIKRFAFDEISQVIKIGINLILDDKK